jgi:hypothetical protein
VIAQFAGIAPPSRAEKRNCADLVRWFRRSWKAIAPWLSLIELRDELNVKIDSTREVADLQ